MSISGSFVVHCLYRIPCPDGQGRHLDLPSPRATPLKHMPPDQVRGRLWSKTPVVSCMLAIAHTGLLPSALCKASAFPRLWRAYPSDHNYTFFGAQYRACALDPSSSRLPLPGLPVDFTTGLPATLWTGGTFAAHAAKCQGKPCKKTHCMNPAPQCQSKLYRGVYDFRHMRSPTGYRYRISSASGGFPTIRVSLGASTDRFAAVLLKKQSF